MIRLLIHVFLGVLYSGMGAFIFVKEWFLTDLNPIAAKALGILFILYGIFRIFRAAKALKTKDY